MKKKKEKTKKMTARDWGIVSLIARRGGKGAHRSKKRPPRTTTKVALKKSLMRNDSHEAFFYILTTVGRKKWPIFGGSQTSNPLKNENYFQ